MSFGYDPEVPAGYQDADIEMAELAALADEQAARSSCVHGSRTSAGECLDCGEILTTNMKPSLTPAPTVWIPNIPTTMLEYLEDHTHEAYEWEVERDDFGRINAITLRCSEDGATLVTLRCS